MYKRQLVHGSGTVGNGSESDSVWLLHRVSVVAGQDFRSADPGTDQNGRRNVQFTLTNEAGDKFYEYTSTNVGQSMAVVMGGRVKEVATIQSLSLIHILNEGTAFRVARAVEAAEL